MIILGGGPAGLLLASQLSPSLRVAILEKRRFGTTTKFWLTNRERMARHGLEESIRFSTNRATVGTFLGPPAVAHGNFSVADESHLLGTLLSRCREKERMLLDESEAVSFCTVRDGLKISSNRGTFVTRLLVDATGGSSPIAATFRLHNLVGFYSIFGAHLDDIDLVSMDVIGAHVIRLGDPPPLFEVIPTSRSSAFVVVFLASRRVVTPIALKAAFDDHVKDNPFFTCKTGAALAPKFGAIPIGQSARRAIPGVVSIGEAAMIQSPLLGAAFNEVLDHSERMADSIAAAFCSTPSGIVTVAEYYPVPKRFNDYLQLLLAKRVTDGSLEDFDALVRYLDKFGPDRAYDLFCTSLTSGGLISAFSLALSLLRGSRFKARRSELGPSWLRPPSEGRG